MIPDGAVCLKGDKGKDWRMGGGAEEEKRTDMTNGEEGNQLVRTNFCRFESLFPMPVLMSQKSLKCLDIRE